jgi:sRNA-binding protein
MKKQEAAAAVIDTLAEKWPNAFFADPQKRRPLKVGVHLDILQALPGVNKKTLSVALRSIPDTPVTCRRSSRARPAST